MENKQVLVYGANGFTGKLVIEALLKRGVKPVLAGRNADALRALSEMYRLDYRVFALGDENPVHFNNIGMVLHCAGPFKHTFAWMVSQCVRYGMHYLDITGEIEVFEGLARWDEKAKAAGITILPGMGFDVVPTDCLANMLHNRLPDAQFLELAFSGSGGGWSAGTSKTMIEGLGQPGFIRKNGKLTPVNMGELTTTIQWEAHSSLATAIPWGDLSTAYISTGIPNITVYTGVTPALLKKMKQLQRWGWLLKWAPLKKYALRTVEKNRAALERKALKGTVSYVWGRVKNAAGQTVEMRLTIPNGYILTAETMAEGCCLLLNQPVKAGYFTPAQRFGSEWITKFENCKLQA